MTQVTIHEAKTHLAKLIQMALDGEEVIIAKRHFPSITVIPLTACSLRRRSLRG